MRLMIVVVTSCFLLAGRFLLDAQATSPDSAHTGLCVSTDPGAMQTPGHNDTEPCKLNIATTTSYACDDCQFVAVEVAIRSVSGPSKGCYVFVDGIAVKGNPIAYPPSGAMTLRVLLPAEVSVHQIFIHDMEEMGCTAILPLEIPDYSSMHTAESFFFPTAPQAMEVWTQVMFDDKGAAVMGEQQDDMISIRPMYIFPNPVHADGQVSFMPGLMHADFGQKGQLYMYHMQGGLATEHEVVCNEPFTFALNGELPGGIYAIHLITERHVYSGRIVIR